MTALISGSAPLPGASKRVFGLDLMRAIAISGVLIGHFGNAVLAPESPELVRFIFAVMAGVGVEIFFVLSGFLIAGLLHKIMTGGRWSVDGPIFLIRRWMRTLPLYYLCLSVYLTAPLFSRGAPEDWWRYLAFLQNVTTPPGFFNISWSLSIEEWFYLAATGGAAALSFAAPRLSPGARLALLAGCFWATSLALRLDGFLNGVDQDTMRLSLIFRFDVIAIGVLGYVWRDALCRISPLWGLPLSIGVIIIAVTRGYYESLIGEPAVEFISSVILQSLIGLGALPLLGVLLTWSRPPEFAGGLFARGVRRQADLAYALYLFHWPALAVAFPAMRGPAHDHMWAFIFFGVGLSYAVAFAVHKTMEAPIMARRPRQPADKLRAAGI